MTLSPSAVPLTASADLADAPDASGAPTSLAYRSPLLDLPGAVAAVGIDAGVALHYGDPLREQRRILDGAALIDHSNRGLLVVAGADRLGWLHSICSQHVSDLTDGESTQALVLSPHGHVEQDWQVTELGGQVWLEVEPGTTDEALAYLLKMRFMKRVEPADVTTDFAVLRLAGPGTLAVLAAAGEPVPGEHAAARADGGFVRRDDVRRTDGTGGTAQDTGGAVEAGGAVLVVARASLAQVARLLLAAGAEPAGAWAEAAIRVEHRQPRLRLETDHRTIPHEIGLINVAVHLNKGCYRGQETVARVHNLGRPPRRLVLLHLSGDRDELPEPGTPVERDGRSIGFLGTAVHHHELGPIALAVVKRTTPDDATLAVAGSPATVAPEPTST